MLGAIIGDIVGSAYEFNPTNDYNFELFPAEANFTDDTVCTIAIADALLRGRDFGESLHDWCRRYPHPKGGYGGRFAQWVRSDNPKPYNSFGNGSAMRVSPIGWWYDELGDLHKAAKASAAFTHNHPEGLEGAEAVAVAIMECRHLKREKGNDIKKEDIFFDGVRHALNCYFEFPDENSVEVEKYRNKFDETCQGTVPAALGIILQSDSFEDAIRRAVSLGADADTLGAIVGSIAEAIWGIPEWMKKKAMPYLPEEMRKVVISFNTRINRLRKLGAQTEYFKFGEFMVIDDKDRLAFDIESEWAHDLAKSYTNAERMKKAMAKMCPMEHWEKWAKEYSLPVSLIGYIFKHTADCGMFMHERVDPFLRFLHHFYSKRVERMKKEKEAMEKLKEQGVLMLWKLGLGNMARLFNGEDPQPDKSKTATKESWKTEPRPKAEDITEMKTDIRIPKADLDIIRKGHIPDAMEDHWFMYCDGNTIRYYRSWTGMPAFEARYVKTASGAKITSLKMNHALCQWGVNGDEAGHALFLYLLAAETGHHPGEAWDNYLKAWDKLNKKYSKK